MNNIVEEMILKSLSNKKNPPKGKLQEKFMAKKAVKKVVKKPTIKKPAPKKA